MSTQWRPAPLGLAAEGLMWDRCAVAASAVVIRTYSTSFGMACRLLGRPVGDRIRAVYAFVRLVDEVADGLIGVQTPQRASVLLDRLQAETAEALALGFSTNPVIHAFALTARECGIDDDLVRPFFDSMRADLVVTVHDEASFARYVYGSAEAVGLMCLRVFLAGSGRDTHEFDLLAPGARALGAAFQKVNFLRDLSEDYTQRGRSYFPGVDPAGLTEKEKDAILDDIDADLARAGEVLRRLPPSARPAVAAAHGIFAQLAVRLRRTPAADLSTRRVRVPNAVKLRIAATSLVRQGR